MTERVVKKGDLQQQKKCCSAMTTPQHRGRSVRRPSWWIAVIATLICVSLLGACMYTPFVWDAVASGSAYRPLPLFSPSPVREFTDQELTARAFAKDVLHFPDNTTKNPKDVFLFLTPGPLPLEDLWERFLRVSNLPSSATEDELCQFFWYCGTVETLKLEKAGSYSKVAFVTFKEPYALETAVLLSGATIAGERVCIQPWGDSEEAVKRWKQDTLNNPSHPQHATPQEDWGSMIPSPGQAANAVSALLSKGYVLGKDALFKAKELDTRYQVSSSAAARVCTLSKNLGITDKINAGTTAVRSVDTRYGISEKGKFVGEKSKYALVAAGNAVSTAGSAVVNSSYFASGALWVSSVLDKAAKSAAELGSRPHK